MIIIFLDLCCIIRMTENVLGWKGLFRFKLNVFLNDSKSYWGDRISIAFVYKNSWISLFIEQNIELTGLCYNCLNLTNTNFSYFRSLERIDVPWTQKWKEKTIINWSSNLSIKKMTMFIRFSILHENILNKINEGRRAFTSLVIKDKTFA